MKKRYIFEGDADVINRILNEDGCGAFIRRASNGGIDIFKVRSNHMYVGYIGGTAFSERAGAKTPKK